MRYASGLAAFMLLFSAPVHAAVDWARVDQALGRSGTEQAGGVHRYSFARSDLNVRLDGVTLKPALALGSWLAFREMGDNAMVMGDLVLRQEEVNPVLSRLLQGGITITAFITICCVRRRRRCICTCMGKAIRSRWRGR